MELKPWLIGERREHGPVWVLADGARVMRECNSEPSIAPSWPSKQKYEGSAHRATARVLARVRRVT